MEDLVTHWLLLGNCTKIVSVKNVLFYPSRSVFKPFIFVPNITQLLKTNSPTFGEDDPVKKKPRFLTQPDRRHELYKKHEHAAEVMEACKVCWLNYNSTQVELQASCFTDVILYKVPVWCWAAKDINSVK